MIRIGLPVFVAALAMSFVASGAQTKGKLVTKFKYYSVSGSTAATLHRNMTVPTGFFSSERVYGNITMSPSFSGTFKPGRKGKSCRIQGFGINGEFVVRLPKLKSGVKLPRSLNRKFRNFVSYVRKHELTHRSIWTRCLRSAEARIKRLRVKSCTRLDAQAANIITSEWAKCEKRNIRFDALEQKRLRRLPLVREAFKPAKRPKRTASKKRSRPGKVQRGAFDRAIDYR
ncbi:hypothetical protein MNBD_ALPHA08-1519 [hydrothermal vent metagenome]|uniref:DUF922 domain-containing protein n=1 Tax=hydrothermal vent metagenome TaxID=652676 RepID=A0A3B0S4N2_9ZZZZ